MAETTKKKKKKLTPDGQTLHTILFSIKATQIIHNKQADLIRVGKRRSIAQIVNGFVEEQIV